MDAGWSSLVARRAHNPKVVGSNPAPATNATLAQLVERNLAKVEVTSSNLVCRSKLRSPDHLVRAFLYLHYIRNQRQQAADFSFTKREWVIQARRAFHPNIRSTQSLILLFRHSQGWRLMGDQLPANQICQTPTPHFQFLV